LPAYVDSDRVFLKYFEQVFLNVFENKVEAAFALESLLEGHDVGVLQHSEHADLTHDCFLGDLVVVGLLKLFDSN